MESDVPLIALGLVGVGFCFGVALIYCCYRVALALGFPMTKLPMTKSGSARLFSPDTTMKIGKVFYAGSDRLRELNVFVTVWIGRALYLAIVLVIASVWIILAGAGL